MKKLAKRFGVYLSFILTFILIAGMSSVCRAKALVTFWFNSDQIGRTKFFDVPLADGRLLYLNLEKHQVDKDGKIKIELNLLRPGIINFENPGLIEVYVEPNCSILVDLRNSVSFSGSLARENNMILQLHRAGYAFAVNDSFRPLLTQRMERCENPTTLLEKLDSAISEAHNIVKELSTSPGVSKEFLTFINADIKMYYYELTFAALYTKLSDYIERPIGADSIKINSPWGIALTGLSERISIEIEREFPQSSQWFFSGLYNFIVRYKVWFLKERNNKVLTDPMYRFNKDLFAFAVPIATKKYLSEKNREFFLANFLAFYITGNINYYSKEMIDLYYNFRRQFPNSIYLAPITTKMSEVISYQNESDVDKPDVKIINEFEKIRSLDELVSHFQGKVIYVDVWATWCGPCVNEFKFYEKLYRLKRQHKDFEILYLSRDDMKNQDKWREFIFKKNLIGTHLIPAKELEAEIASKINWTEIPRYVLINKYGEIVEKDAPSPSSKNTISLIQSYLNKD